MCQKKILKCLSICVLRLNHEFPERWLGWQVYKVQRVTRWRLNKAWRFDIADVLKLYDLGIVLHRIISWFMSRCFYNNVVSSHASSSSWFRERRHHRGCSSLWGNPCCWAGGVGEPRSTGSGVVSVICFWKALHSPKPEVKEHKS